MNKNLFCVLYSKAHGRWIVVRESVLSKGAAHYCGCIPMLVGCMSAVVALHPSLQAQVVAAPNAPNGTRPVVDASANGKTLVQIAAANGSGLSNNHYTQFNVGNQGVILNNSQGLTLTQLGGYVNGNPFLGAGTAKIILNQVVGTSPSSISG